MILKILRKNLQKIKYKVCKLFENKTRGCKSILI